MKRCIILFIACIVAVYALGDAETEINLMFAGMIPDNACNNCGNDNTRNLATNSARAAHDESITSEDADCSFLDFNTFRDALAKSVCGHAWPCPADGVPGEAGDNGGLGLNMWATAVNRAGRICAVTYSGPTNTDQWPASRVLSMQKAVTANSMSVDILALSSANLYQATQPGGTLYGIESSNPVSTVTAYGGLSQNYGNKCGASNQDPACGRKVGGVVAVGGGLAVYIDGKVLGGVGVSGDTSCADHNVAWKVRDALAWDDVSEGAGNYFDNIIYPAAGAQALPAFGHPMCSTRAMEVAQDFPVSHPIGGNSDRPKLVKRSVEEVQEPVAEEKKASWVKPKVFVPTKLINVPPVKGVPNKAIKTPNIPADIARKIAVTRKNMRK